MRDTRYEELKARYGIRVNEIRRAIKPKDHSFFAFRIPNLVYSLSSYPVIPELRNEISGISCLAVGNDVVQSVMIRGRGGESNRDTGRDRTKNRERNPSLFLFASRHSLLSSCFQNRTFKIQQPLFAVHAAGVAS